MATVPPRSARTVLIIDDSESLRQRLETVLLSRGIFRQCLLAHNGARGLELLFRNDVDLIVCDLEMPGMDGLKFLRALEGRSAYIDIPLIMLTGRDDVSVKVAALNAGASDYLTKPFHEEELIARVRVHLHIKALQDELRAKNARLEQLSTTDELTGVANRRRLIEDLRRELARAERGRELAFLMLDLDHFKAINDRYGHLAGDQALVEVASRLRAALPDHAVLGRYGGEEFGVVLAQSNAGSALGVAERCRQAVSAEAVDCGAAQLGLSVSIGLAVCPGAGALGVDELVRMADAALYRAKAQGRDRVVLATPADGASLQPAATQRPPAA